MGDLSEHFSKSEFACKCGCTGPPPIDMLLVAGLEALRAKVGKPIRVVSGFRCSKRNSEVGGKLGGYHPQGKAADITVAGMTPRELYEQAMDIVQFRGFGVNDHGNTLHVDVRGLPTRWCYDDHNHTVPWFDPPVVSA